jgi:hypothetical protein
MRVEFLRLVIDGIGGLCFKRAEGAKGSEFLRSENDRLHDGFVTSDEVR